ncbi:MAG: hypothetical protein GF308_14800 [Candidatus Heimdallarchaeota archaeon]|nr:hypothetical protein [Candidatus Heimdallarchaeota archaeon]
MKQPTATQVPKSDTLFLSFQKRLKEVKHQRQQGFPAGEEPSAYARWNYQIIRCWQINPLQDILDAFAISKAWFYRLLHKFINEGLAGLEDRRGRPAGTGKKLTPLEEGLLVKLRTGCPSLGSRRLADILGSHL